MDFLQRRCFSGNHFCGKGFRGFLGFDIIFREAELRILPGPSADGAMYYSKSVGQALFNSNCSVFVVRIDIELLLFVFVPLLEAISMVLFSSLRMRDGRLGIFLESTKEEYY